MFFPLLAFLQRTRSLRGPLVRLLLLVVLLGGVTSRTWAQTPGLWKAFDIATSNGNDTRLIWRTPDNGFQIWNLNDSGAKTQASPLFAPATWVPVKLGVAGDGTTRVLIRRSDGAAAVWGLDANLNLSTSTPAYGPYAGWTPVDMAVARDGSTRLLWTTSGGQASLWNIDTAGNQSISPTYGAFGDGAGGTWSARRIGIGGDGLVRVLWTTSGGQASLWTLDSALNRTAVAPTFGPYTNTLALALALDTSASSSNKIHMLWPRSDGAATFWRLGTDNATREINTGFGPYAGWTVQALSVGGDGQMRALWTHTDGYAAFWKLSPDGTTFPVNVTYGPLPQAAPTNLTATAGNAQVALSWTAAANATSYSVKSSTTDGGPYTTLATGVTATTSTDTGLTKGTTYYYVVSATGGGAESVNSSQVSATPPTPPSAPTGVLATPGNSQVSLSWSAVSGATSYQVFRSTTSNSYGATPLASPTTTTLTDTGLTNDTLYYYVVKAVGAGGTSPASAQVSAIPGSYDIRLSATPGDGQATLSWGFGPGSNTRNITGWGVKRAPATGGSYTLLTPTLAASAASYSDTGLTNGTTYFYRVFPILANGNGADSNEASVVPMRAIPSGDIVLTGAAMNGSTRLWWNASARAAQYILFRRVGVGDWSQLATLNPSANPTYTEAGLTNGTIYAYRVRATNESGASTDSNIVSLSPNPNPPLAPAAPTFGTTTTTSIVVNVPALPYGATELRLYIGLSSDPSQMQPLATGLTSASAPTVTASGLTPGATYSFYARAVNSFGSTPGPVASTYTASSPGGPGTTIAAPLIGSITYGVIGPSLSTKGHSITVYGATPPVASQTPTGPPTLYVQWKQQGDPDDVYTQSGHDVATSSNNGNVFFAQIKPLSPLTTYVFRFRAVDSSTSPATTTYSPTSSATTLPDPPDAPPAPSIVAGSLTDHSLTVNVPPLPARATGLTLYWGHPFISYDGTLEPPLVNGNYYSAQNMPSGATTVTVSNLNGGQATQLLWGASDVTGSTYSPTTSVTTQGSGLAAPDPPAFLNLWTDSVEVIVPANVANYQNTSGLQMLLQAKVTGTADSSYQTLLFDGGNPTDSYRTLSSAGTSGINEHPEVGPLDPLRRLLVNSLTPGQSYTFRFVAYQMSSPSTTQVNGAPASITIPSETLTWSSGPAIACAGIRYPWNGLSARSGGVYHLNSYEASDWDMLTHSVAGFSWNQYLTSPCLYGWSADSGSFPEGIKGPNVLWQAPVVSVPTDITLYLQVSDSNTDAAHVSVGRRETGARVDAPILAGDRPLQFQVTVHVNP